jgi:hypothetical protein
MIPLMADMFLIAFGRAYYDGAGTQKSGLLSLALVVSGGLLTAGEAAAADYSTAPLPAAKAAKYTTKIDCKAPDAPYKDYKCLDAYLGDGFWERFYNYYLLEWGRQGPPADPSAPPSRRDNVPTTPQTTPPMPFTEWPYGGSTALGVTRGGSIDSPLMVALANTGLGKWMNENSIQTYGWINVGGNLSTSSVKPGGNWPAAYDFTPNTIQLDQAVIYLERLPDTVQTDHIDWGFRLSAIYGENYRYTTAYGLMSYQLQNQDLYNGVDFPMLYGEMFFPQFAQGLIVRVGRYISIPDIEAQLAPNNYMYSHSMTYTYDNYTNTGIATSLAYNKNWIFQLGLTVGTEAMPWHMGQTIVNPFPNQVFPSTTMLRDPGAVPSITGGLRWTSDSGRDDFNIVANGINSGTWGYNNLQWYGLTYYHKFSDQWHLAFEAYTLSQRNDLNQNNPTAQGIVAANGFPFGAPQITTGNGPGFAQCPAYQVTCTARSIGTVAYLNYQFSPLDNISVRPEFFDDQQGQRTGTKTRYVDFGIGWQHWFSPQVEVRPEVTYYRSLDAPAFNGNFDANPVIPPTRNYALVGAADIIWHF